MFIPQSYGNFIGSDPCPILLEHTLRFTQQSVLATQEMPQDLPPKKERNMGIQWGYGDRLWDIYIYIHIVNIYIWIYIYIYIYNTYIYIYYIYIYTYGYIMIYNDIFAPMYGVFLHYWISAQTNCWIMGRGQLTYTWSVLFWINKT